MSHLTQPSDMLNSIVSLPHPSHMMSLIAIQSVIQTLSNRFDFLLNAKYMLLVYYNCMYPRSWKRNNATYH